MRLRCCPQAPPNKIKPLPRTISAGARRLCSRRRRRRAGALLHVAAPDSRPLETVCADSTGQGTQPRFSRPPGSSICVLLSLFRIVDDAMYRDEDKFCLVEMEVRDCELDQYGLVSSDVYVDYLENGRQHYNMGCASASRSIITSPLFFFCFYLDPIWLGKCLLRGSASAEIRSHEQATLWHSPSRNSTTTRLSRYATTTRAHCRQRRDENEMDGCPT